MKISKYLYSFIVIVELIFTYNVHAQSLVPHLDTLTGKYGYKSNPDDSTWIIMPSFGEKAWAFSDQYARVKTADGYNFILINSKFLSQRWFIDAGDFKNNIAPVLHNEAYFEIKRDSIRFKDSTVCQETTLKKERLRWNFICPQVTYEDSVVYNKVFKSLDSVVVTKDEETNLPIKQFFRIDSLFVADSSIVKIAKQSYTMLFEYGFENYHYIDKHYIIVQNQKKGLLNPKGKCILKTEFEEIIWADTNCTKNKFLIKKDHHWAIADTSGKLLTGFHYLQIKPLSNGYFKVEDSTGVYYLNESLHELIKQRYQDAGDYEGGFALVKKDSLWGIIDHKGKELVKPAYHYIGWSQDSLKSKLFINHKIQTLKNGFWGMVTDKGKIFLENKYNQILPEVEQFIAVNAIERYGYHPDGVWGFYDTKGKLKVSLRYDKLEHQFRNGVAVVGYFMMQKIKPAELEIRLGLIDASGKELTGFLYKQITKVSEQLFALQNNDNLWGFCDAKGNMLHPCNYDEFKVLNDKQIKVEKFGKWGLVEANGNVIFEPIYKSISFNEGRWVVEKFNSYTIYRDSLGFAKHEFDYFKSAAPNIFIFGLNGYFGLIDVKGKVILKNSYTQIEPFKYGISVVKINGKYGVINKEGKYVLQPDYDYIERDTLGYLRVKGKEIHDYGHVKVVVSEVPKWGLLDSLGHTILEIKHTNILPQTEGIFPVKRGNLWGYFNMVDDQIIPFQFTIASQFKHGLAIVFKDSVELLINRDGAIVNKLQYDAMNILGPHTIVFLKNNKYGIMNHHGVQTLPPCYDEMIQVASTVLLCKEQDSIYTLVNFDGIAFWAGFTDSISHSWIEDMLPFKGDTAWQVFNHYGKQVLPHKPKYEKIESYSNGYARMTYGGKLGFIDQNGKLRISNQYDEISHFHEDMCAFKLLGKWGYIDKAEHIWVQPAYEKALDFQGGLGAVYKQNKWGFVDNRGKEITKLLYSEVRYDGKGFYAVKRNNNWGMVNRTLGEFLFTKYEQVEMLGDTYVKIGSEGKYGAANLKGQLIVPIEYDSIDYDDFNKTVIAIIKAK